MSPASHLFSVLFLFSYLDLQSYLTSQSNPSLNLQLSNFGILLGGVAGLGLSVAFIFVPLLPEIVSSVSEKEGIPDSSELSDKASGIYNSAYGIGNCAAPLIGGALNGAFATKGFNKTCDILALGALAFFVFYLCFSVLPACCIKHNPGADNLDEQLGIIKEEEDTLLANYGEPGISTIHRPCMPVS